MFKIIKSRWTMKPTGQSFYDSIAGEDVKFWVDCYGVEWMAVSKWGMRVSRINQKIKK